MPAHFNDCPDCGAPKNEDYPTCFKCAQDAAAKEGRLCDCGKFKKEEFDVCFACNLQKNKGYGPLPATEDFEPDESGAMEASPQEPRSAVMTGTPGGVIASAAGERPAPVDSLLFLDTETTGLTQPRLVQLAYIHLPSRTSVVNALFRPPCAIEEGAARVHGYDDAAVAAMPPFYLSPAWHTLQDLLDRSILVCHNAAYDMKVLANENLKVPHAICTMNVAKSLMPRAPNHKLQGLRAALGLGTEEEKAHSAWGDVCTLGHLFKALVQFYKMQTFKADGDIHQDFIRFTKSRQ